MPIVEGWKIWRDAVTRESGLAGRARFAMSHESGKIEICGVDRRRIYLRYHRSKHAENRGRFFSCRRDDEAYWLDQLEPAAGSFIPHGVSFECFGGTLSEITGGSNNGHERTCTDRETTAFGRGCGQIG